MFTQSMFFGESVPSVLPYDLGIESFRSFVPTPIVDCDVDVPFPFKPPKGLPPVLTVKENLKNGKITFDPFKFRLHMPLAQVEKKNGVHGIDLWREELRTEENLQGRIVQNYAMLEFCIAHQELLPAFWSKDSYQRTRFIYFWGTLFENQFDQLCVCCIFKQDSKKGAPWKRGCLPITAGFGPAEPALVYVP